jgi:hypothetical protein
MCTHFLFFTPIKLGCYISVIFDYIIIKDLKQQTVFKENPDHDIIAKIKKEQQHNDKTHQHQNQSKVLAVMLIYNTIIRFQNLEGI